MAGDMKTNGITSDEIQLQNAGVPEHMWPIVIHKVKNGVFDAGEFFSFTQVEDEHNINKWEVVAIEEIALSSGTNDKIFLIDHAYTFTYNSISEQLCQMSNLEDRMVSLMNINPIGKSTEELRSHIKDEIWKYSQAYTITLSGDRSTERTFWYVMDELGSRIQHSADPNCRVVPFYYETSREAYSLLFPIKNISGGESLTRDYVECRNNVVLAHQKELLMFPWEPVEIIDDCLVDGDNKLANEGFLQASRTDETLPEVSNLEILPFSKERRIKVYSEYEYMKEYLTHKRFEIVADKGNADVLWLLSHYKNYLSLSKRIPIQYINQFPYEHVITTKDLLCQVAKRKNPNWAPVTFNLVSELGEFIKYYQENMKENVLNYWICKPWNRARGIDIVITSNLNCLLRLPFAGPVIAQQYLERPVLFKRPDDIGAVKFDIRFIICLKSVSPLVCGVYKKFWLRFANKEFELDHFDDLQMHLTVMNYNNAQLLQMFCHDFIDQFEQQYPAIQWSEVELKIHKMVQELLEAATSEGPPFGIGHSPQSRSMYGIDVMLVWNDKNEIKPMLLECNWMPDCERACQYYPHFFNDLLEYLFLDVENDDFVTL